jgi:serine/threonine protein kinase
MLLKGRFEILKGYENNHVTIGFGSYGQVKLARDLQTGNVVAVKVVSVDGGRSTKSPRTR